MKCRIDTRCKSYRAYMYMLRHQAMQMRGTNVTVVVVVVVVVVCMLLVIPLCTLYHMSLVCLS